MLIKNFFKKNKNNNIDIEITDIINNKNKHIIKLVLKPHNKYPLYNVKLRLEGLKLYNKSKDYFKRTYLLLEKNIEKLENNSNIEYSLELNNIQEYDKFLISVKAIDNNHVIINEKRINKQEII